MSRKRIDDTEIKRFIGRLEFIESSQSQVALNRKLGVAYGEYVQTRFDGRKDPGNKKWKKRTRYYSHPILEKTGEMRRGFTPENMRVNMHGFKFTVPGYTAFHQRGTKHMVARRVAPERQLPRELREIFGAIYADHIRATTRGKR